MNRIEQRVRYVDLTNGEKLAIVDTEIPEDAPTVLREGKFKMPSRALRREAIRRGSIIEITVAHENNCPATSELMWAAHEVWANGGAR